MHSLDAPVDVRARKILDQADQLLQELRAHKIARAETTAKRLLVLASVMVNDLRQKR